MATAHPVGAMSGHSRPWRPSNPCTSPNERLRFLTRSKCDPQICQKIVTARKRNVQYWCILSKTLFRAYQYERKTLFLMDIVTYPPHAPSYRTKCNSYPQHKYCNKTTCICQTDLVVSLASVWFLTDFEFMVQGISASLHDVKLFLIFGRLPQ